MAQLPSSKDDQDKMMNNTSQGSDRQASQPTPTVVGLAGRPNRGQHQQPQAYAFRTALILLGAAIVTLPVYLYLASQAASWQLMAIIGITVGFVGVAAASAWLARQGRTSLSVSLLLGGLSLLGLAMSMLVFGMGVIIGYAFSLLTLVIVSRTLTRSRAMWMNVFGILMGTIYILVSMFWTTSQVFLPQVQLVISVYALIAFAFAGVTLVRQFSTYPLRVKMVIILAGVAFLSINAVAFTANLVIRMEIQQQAGNNLNVLAKGKVLEIGTMLERDRNILESLAIDESLQKQVRAANINGSNDPADLTRADELWKTAEDSSDPQIASVLNNQVSEELRRYQGRFPEYREIFLTNKYGATIASTNRTSDYYQADEAWWQLAWNEGLGGLYISQPQWDESSEAYAINIALPVYAEESAELIGILRATVDVSSLKDSLRAGEFGQTGSVDLVFPDRQYLHDDPEQQLVNLDPESADRLASLRDSFGAFEYEGMPSIVSKSLVSSSNPENKQAIEALGWHVVTHQDQAEAMKAADTLIRATVLTAHIVLLLASALAFFIGRRLTTSLTQLTSVAARVSEGDLTAQAPVTSQDEIGTLAGTFNSMTRQLRSLLGSLEHRVAERTRDLELASEVGRTVSEKVDDLKTLLSEAVELIGDRFNLYYTQIYLVEANGQTLKLRAGTGEVGRILLQRGHHLLIGSGSLNGRAASQKQAIIVADTAQNPSFLPNPLLPNTRSEMAVPLIAGGKVVGVLDMQSERPGALSEAELSAFEAMAGQLAIAIQNATLFAEAGQSKMEVEAQARRLTRNGWQEFLDAVERSEQLGYAFDQNYVVPLEAAGPVQNERVLTVPIMITGEQVGTFQIANETHHAWLPDEVEIACSTANLLAKQIENLRLLARAERYRAESEQIALRLTHEGWESYLRTRQTLADGYAYDSNTVRALAVNGRDGCSPAFSRPVVVRDAVIGELAVDRLNGSGEAAEQILVAVADQLSEHIENLRLLEEAEQSRVEIQQGEARLAEALRIARLAHWEYDPIRDVFTFNDHFFSIFRTTAEQEGGYQLSSTAYATRFVHPDDMPLVGAEIGKALAVTERYYNTKLEHRVMYRDGGVGYISVNVNVERDEQGNITRFYGANQDITERKNAEVALRESEQRYQQILDAITDMVLVKGEKSRIVWANRSFRDYYGMSNEQLRDMIDAPIVDPDYTQQYIKDDAYVFETGNVLSIAEEPCTRYDGMVFPFETVKAPIRDINNRIVMTVGVSRDITERKKNQEIMEQRARDLEEAQSFLTSVIENLPTMLFVKDATDLRFVRWNKAAEDLAGFKRADLIGKNDFDFFPREEADFFTNKDRQVLASGQMLDIPEEPLATAHQGTRYLHTRKVPIYDVDGNAKYLLGVSEDITERKQATETLARRATELATVAQVSTTASTVLDPDKLLQAVVNLTKERFGLYHVHVYLLNESWNTLLLASGAGEVGRKLVEEEHAISLDSEQSLVARAARSGDVIIVNDVSIEPGFLANPLLPETQAEMAVPMIVGSKVLGVFDVQSNEPQGFSAEDASIYTTLAAQVAVALQNARLYVEQSATVSQLRELDRLKSSFLANMSHELRTPLNSILGFADVMLEELDGPLTENMDNDLRLIQKNGQHLLHLINDVLDMAKIEAGRMNLNPETFRLHEVLDEVTSITSTLASEKNLALFVEAGSDQEVEIYADHTRLRQVMINLVNNAIKFTETGRISLKIEPIEGARVLISVKDTGIGIPPDKLEAVFQEFTQVDTSSTRKVGGTGLGLPISRRLVEMHGGRLWAESNGIPGEGSVFFVELPVEARITEVIEKQTR